MLKIRFFDLDPGTGRPHDPVKDMCRLFYLASGEYLLYSSKYELLWRSDNIPRAAFLTCSRLGKLRETTEDIIRLDLGSDTQVAELYVASEDYKLKLHVLDQEKTLTLYPDLIWLYQIAEKVNSIVETE